MVLAGLIVLSIFLSSLQVFAEDQDKAAGPPAPNGKYEVFLSSAGLTFATSLTKYDLTPGVGYSFFPWLQLGTELGFSSNTYRGAATYSLHFLAGPTFNFGSTALGSNYLLSLGGGWRVGRSDTYDTNTKSPNGFGFYFLVGKRFPLFGALCFRPTLGVMLAGTPAFVVRPLAISMIF